MYMSTIKATMTTAAMATMATVDAATITRHSFPAACSQNLSGERYGSRSSERLRQPRQHHEISMGATRSMPRTRSGAKP
jgi:hypothetical protein